MKLVQLRTHHLSTPLGASPTGGAFSEKPVFTWAVEEAPGKKQVAAQLEITDPQGIPVYHSGKRENISSLGFEADFFPLPRTRYTWTVTVWDETDCAASETSWFETAKQDEPWQASWIAAQCGTKDDHVYLARDFVLEEEVESARVYACGLGVYELELNGQKAGEEVLLPGFHCYETILEYQTFDITSLVHKGENAIGFSLGNGWYKGRFTFDSFVNTYGDTLKAICEVHITLKSGKTFFLSTDGSWKSALSPIVMSNIYDGEHFDSRRAIPGWSTFGCPAFSQGVVLLSDEDTRKLIPRLGPNILIKERFAPVQVIHTPKGETVLDFGQNLTGWVEFTVEEPPETQVTLSFGEILQGGCFYRDNLRTAKSQYQYDSDGSKARVRPHFTFYGFRYVKVEGMSQIRPEDFTACHIRSDVDPIGSIETGDPNVNQLFHNALWGQFDNFLDIPTDCPQRDERMGWTGDAALICGTACKNSYLPAFFQHYMRNIEIEQKFYKGSVPFYVPTPKQAQEKEGFWITGSWKGCAIWSDVATILPWTLYENYGDLGLLAHGYPVMKTWLERIREDDRADGDKGLWLRGHQLGDWLALDTQDPQNCYGATSLPYTATAFYYYSCQLTRKAAQALGHQEDAAEYQRLEEKIKKAFLAEYFTPTGEFTVEGTQTACVLSLFFRLFPEGGEGKVLQQLKDRIAAKNNHLDTGFCGTPFLCRVLSDYGAHDLATTLFLNDDFPSWLYEVKMGATTVWERWNSVLPDGSISGTGMNSLNHYAYGAIVDWMYRNLCGFNACEERPGYRLVRIAPMPIPQLGFARMKLNTASGEYRVAWEYQEDTLRFTVTVPFDCQAQLLLPDGTSYLLSAGTYQF